MGIAVMRVSTRSGTFPEQMGLALAMDLDLVLGRAVLDEYGRDAKQGDESTGAGAILLENRYVGSVAMGRGSAAVFARPLVHEHRCKGIGHLPHRGAHRADLAS